jgi:hypothetical protein
MKLYIIILLAVVSVCLLAVAATKEWSIGGGTYVRQLVADGAGGCAFFWHNTNGYVEIVWVAKKGVIRYRKKILVGSQKPILRCGKKELVYLASSTSSLPFVVHVDSKGTEQEIKVPHTIIKPPYESQANYLVPSDKKGFFVSEFKTNPPMAESVVRYSYK